MTSDLILAIDQGTTSTRAIVFDRDGAIHGSAQRPLTQLYSRPGWIEHDPDEIWQATLDVARTALSGHAVAGIGIANQRETAVVWERATGRPIHPAIVWQDRRTAGICRALIEAGHEAEVTARTGLVIDPYFSATKIAWLLDHTGQRAAAERGALAFGTVDSFLLWRLTGGRVHATDATNASRTLLMDLATCEWDAGLVGRFGIPAAALPAITDCAGPLGETVLLGRTIPITGDRKSVV